jgi:hypothetical protein
LGCFASGRAGCDHCPGKEAFEGRRVDTPDPAQVFHGPKRAHGDNSPGQAEVDPQGADHGFGVGGIEIYCLASRIVHSGDGQE